MLWQLYKKWTYAPMWWVSNWTVGISLRGICPEPPSPQQPKQHVNIAAILPRTHIRKQTIEELRYFTGTVHSSDAQRWRLGSHKPLPPRCIQSQRLRSAVAPDGMETREENQGQTFYTWQTNYWISMLYNYKWKRKRLSYSASQDQLTHAQTEHPYLNSPSVLFREN